MSFKGYLWAIDPIGSLLFITSATLMLLALDWAGGAYAWSDVHVAVPLAVGLALLVAFAGYGTCSESCRSYGNPAILISYTSSRLLRRHLGPG